MRILNHLWGPVIIISETFELLYAETYAWDVESGNDQNGDDDDNHGL